MRIYFPASQNFYYMVTRWFKNDMYLWSHFDDRYTIHLNKVVKPGGQWAVQKLCTLPANWIAVKIGD